MKPTTGSMESAVTTKNTVFESSEDRKSKRSRRWVRQYREAWAHVVAPLQEKKKFRSKNKPKPKATKRLSSCEVGKSLHKAS